MLKLRTVKTMQYDDHIIPAFDNKNATRLVENQLFRLNPITMQDNYEIDTLLLTQEVIELNERKVFLEGVANYLGNVAANDTEAMLAEVQERYANKGIELKKAVKGWFGKTDVSPSTDQAYRRNLYDFCYALDMDYQTTAEFFLKSFLTIPFNYKDKDDAVYFYCMKMGRDYKTLQHLLDEADKLAITNTNVDITEQIGMQILSIEKDDEFIKYLQNHCYDRKHQYETAKAKIADYILQNKSLVPGKGNDAYENLGTKKNSALLAAILGYRYQGLEPQQRKHMKASGLPTFPRDADIDKVIATENEASFDILRKTLILMKFYNFYRNLQVATRKLDMDDEDINANLYDFFDETNEELAQCGFVQMYLRNPFDWIIVFCANSPDPISYLQDFLQKRYLGELEY